jgi:hypothetical protein
MIGVFHHAVDIAHLVDREVVLKTPALSAAGEALQYSNREVENDVAE